MFVDVDIIRIFRLQQRLLISSPYSPVGLPMFCLTTQQWQVHRMLRPEAYGGLVHNTLMKNVITPLPDSILRNTVRFCEPRPVSSVVIWTEET